MSNKRFYFLAFSTLSFSPKKEETGHPCISDYLRRETVIHTGIHQETEQKERLV